MNNSNNDTYLFSNQRDAERFARAQGGPVLIEIAHLERGVWAVTVTSR